MSFFNNSKFSFIHKWFDRKNIKPALSFILTLMTMGKGLMNIYPFLFVDETSQTDLEIKQSIESLYDSLLISSIALFLLALIFFREDPPKDYGYINKSESDDIEEEQNYLGQLKCMFKNTEFLRYQFIVCMVCSNLANISDVTNIIMLQFGHTQLQGSFCLCGFYFVGIIGSFCYDYYLDNKSDERRNLQLYTASGFVNKNSPAYLSLALCYVKSSDFVLYYLYLIRLLHYESISA